MKEWDTAIACPINIDKLLEKKIYKWMNEVNSDGEVVAFTREAEHLVFKTPEVALMFRLKFNI